MNMVGLPPGMIITRVRRDVDAEALVQIGGDRLAQRQDAGRRRIAVMAVTQRLHRRLDDEIRRTEIGLADAEADDIAALRRERVGAGEHGKGVFLADAIEGRNGFQHVSLPDGRGPKRTARAKIGAHFTRLGRENQFATIKSGPITAAMPLT